MLTRPLLFALLLLQSAHADNARDIIAQAGTDFGLCVHLGCGRAESATLTADLAAGSSWLVHGLAFDAVSAERARRAIAERRVAGQAIVECVPATPLPYSRHLANVVVIEDWDALARAGITRAEVERITAPGGVIVSRQGNTWARTVRARPATMDTWTHTARGGKTFDLSVTNSNGAPTTFVNRAARGACVQGYVPANGLYFTTQNKCGCTPAQLPGVIAYGPVERRATTNDFIAPRPVEKGPAFGKVTGVPDQPSDWPQFLHAATRASAVPGTCSTNLAVVWTTPLTTNTNARLAGIWDAQCAGPLSAPVSVAGQVFVAAREAGQLVALDTATGKEQWRYSAGSRIHSAPSVSQGYCYFGAHDGYLYALRASDGALAWRVRVAPMERRMVAWGQVESVWPVPGVAVHDGKVFATAGRNTESDGGLALAAFEPSTGQTLWARQVVGRAGSGKGGGPGRQCDLPVVRGTTVAVSYLAFDCATGADATNAPGLVTGMSGIRDPMWQRYGFGRNRSGGHQAFGFTGEYFAWDDDRVVVCSARDNRFFGVSRAKLATGKPDPKLADWTAPGQATQAVALCGDLVFVAGGGELRCLRADTGAVTATIPLPASPAYTGLAVARERVYVALANGQLIALAHP